jgi:hypothetical protein
MNQSEIGFKRIRIKEADHKRLVKRVTYERKIHDVITEALDALDKQQQQKEVKK